MVQRSRHGPTQRQLRVGELVRHTLVEVLARGDVRDPDLEGIIVTVSEVRVSPDLRHATAFVAPLGGGDAAPIVKALTRCKRFLRGELGRRITMKFTPELHFEADRSFDEASHIDEILRSDRVRRDLAEEDGEAE
ncbi:MAG: 30S ribosome-binding factor RbfA [Alphaproteobacteria bacterium]